MPPKRPTRQNAEKNDVKKRVHDHAKVMVEQNQWVSILNESILEETRDIENRPTWCKLRHPKSDQGALFLFTHEDKNVYEVTRFREEFRAWLIDNTVQSDGGMMITTPVDPIFLILPYLIQSAESGKYMTLDQIIHDEDFPECIRLLHTSGISELHQVTETRGPDDLQAYKFDKDKALSWLKLKVESVTEVLMKKEVCVSGAKSVTYIASNKEKQSSKDEYLDYAYGIVSDYIPESLSTSLSQYLGIPAVVEKRPTETDNAPPSKVSVVLLFQYNEQLVPCFSSAPPSLKLTSAQKQLSKVDKSGMKNISSFFSKSKS
ncbi:hypothetical protein ScPMuIL_018579 [Solemya velum]